MTKTRQDIIDLIFGRWRSQILYAGAKLGVIETLTDGRRSATHIAQTLSLHPVNSYRLLRGLACIGVLEESDDRMFSLTAGGEFLREDHPQTLRGMALLEGGPQHYAVWRHLCDIVREGGEDGFVREFGHPIFAHTDADPAYSAVFNEAMSSFSAGETQLVLEALADCDFAEASHLCDVGGGQGYLLCSLLEWKPGTRGTVYDLPATFEDPDRLWAGKMNLADRCEYVPGDIFKSVPEAHVYFMKHILHDWKDAECVQILKNIHSASPSNARVFVAEFVIPDAKTPHFAKLFDVHMMCGSTGQERTKQEYAALFDQSGWNYVKTWYPASKLMGVVEAAKA